MRASEIPIGGNHFSASIPGTQGLTIDAIPIHFDATYHKQSAYTICIGNFKVATLRPSQLKRQEWKLYSLDDLCLNKTYSTPIEALREIRSLMCPKS
jgi:hypothetical protein